MFYMFFQILKNFDFIFIYNIDYYVILNIIRIQKTIIFNQNLYKHQGGLLCINIKKL